MTKLSTRDASCSLAVQMYWKLNWSTCQGLWWWSPPGLPVLLLPWFCS